MKRQVAVTIAALLFYTFLSVSLAQEAGNENSSEGQGSYNTPEVRQYYASSRNRWHCICFWPGIYDAH